MRYISGSNEPLQRYGHSNLSKMVACRQLGFDVTGNSAIRSADPENRTLEPNMKCIGLLILLLEFKISDFLLHGCVNNQMAKNRMEWLDIWVARWSSG